jgi:hypothetical protein
MAVDPVRVPEGPGHVITVGEQVTIAQSLLAIDFQGVYQLNVASAIERLAMLRFSLSLLAAPFGAAVALVSARVVAPAALMSWPHVPRYLFGLLGAFGVLAVLPYLRMIEASVTHARTARAMNNFRLLYTLELRTEFAALGWSPSLPVDPRFPAVFAPLAWPVMSACTLAVLEAGWIAVGFTGLSGRRPPSFMLAAEIAAIAGLLLWLYYLRARRSIQRPPANPFNFPRADT